MNLRVLVLQNENDDPIHLMGSWMGDVDLTVCRPFDGDQVPSTMAGYAGLVVMGGAMGANDDTPWLPAARDLIRSAAGTQTPTLGICLGHQLAAVALGGEVRRNSRGKQFGLLEIGWEAGVAADPLLGAAAAAQRALQWNDDVVTRLPDGAQLLATARTGEVQAARLAPTAWGVQWHPEVDEPMVRAWAADGGVDPAEAERQLAVLAAAADELEAAWRPLAQRFAELATTALARR
ncbi:MAG: type 1 glutamine amidotransferase [Nocardioides sp.]